MKKVKIELTKKSFRTAKKLIISTAQERDACDSCLCEAIEAKSFYAFLKVLIEYWDWLILKNIIIVCPYIQPKTAYQWFCTFPEEYRIPALKYRNKKDKTKYSSPAKALNRSFSWFNTKQGRLFWYTFCVKLDKEYLSPKYLKSLEVSKMP